MQKIKALGTKGFAAQAAPDGNVVCSIRGKARTYHFAFSQDDIPQIVARMIAAHAEAAQIEGRLPHAIVAQLTVVAIDRATQRVTLSLMPTDVLHVPFSMTTKLASETSEALAKAVATLEPPPSHKPH